MNINKSHRKSPPKRSRKARSSSPIERVKTAALLASVKRDIKQELKRIEAEAKTKKKRGL
jgi:hypothetical protein